jgi:site-specific DNA recombinase
VYNRLKRKGIGKYSPRYKQNDQSTWIIVENAHPEIVSRDQWISVNALSKQRFGKINRFSTESPYLLAGLIRCSHCHFAFTGRTLLVGKPGNRKRKSVYIDSGYARKGPSVCASLNIDKIRLEQFILNFIREQILPESFQQRLCKMVEKVLSTAFPDIEKKRKEIKNSLKECEKKMSSLLALVEKGVKVDTIVNRIKILEDEKSRLNKSLREMQNQNYGINSFNNIVKESKEFLENFVDEFQRLSLPEQKEGMKKIVEKIIVDRENRIARCFINPLLGAKQNILFDEKYRNPQLNIRQSFVLGNQPIDVKQLNSSLVDVPPTRFELVFQA